MRGYGVAKSWFGWLTGKSKKDERRRDKVPPAVMNISVEDIDPLTSALRWDRFAAMVEAEQAQAPGVLLIVDLSAHSGSATAVTGHNSAEVLPWLADAIRRAIRADDLLAHVEGYRFAVLLRGAPQEIGAAVSERILESVDDTVFTTAQGVVHLDVAVGGAVYRASPKPSAVKAAMANLDLARQAGKALLVQ